MYSVLILKFAFLTVACAIDLESMSGSNSDDIRSSICPNSSSIHFLNNPESCQAYFLCINGTLTSGQCDFGLHFNEQEQLCDSPQKVRCSDPACPSGIGHISRRGSCNRYQLCVQGIVVQDLECPRGSNFDALLGQCNFPELVKCNRDICPKRIDPFDFVIEPSPDDCSKYYICNNNKQVEFTCAPGFHWNSYFRKCVFAENADCEVTKPTFTCPIIKDPNSLKLSFHPHPLHRDQYFICVGQTPYLRSCGKNLIFNRGEGRCTNATPRD